MGKTIGRKVLTMVGILGLLLLGIVLANLSALSIINGFNKEIESNINQYMDAAKQGNSEQMQEIEESLTSILYHNTLRIEGTCTFDMVVTAMPNLLPQSSLANCTHLNYNKTVRIRSSQGKALFKE